MSRNNHIILLISQAEFSFFLSFPSVVGSFPKCLAAVASIYEFDVHSY